MAPDNFAEMKHSITIEKKKLIHDATKEMIDTLHSVPENQKVVWYLIVSGVHGVGTVHAEYYTIPKSINWLPMDGEWHKVSDYPIVIKILDKKLALGHSLPWYKKRGSSFQVWKDNQ